MITHPALIGRGKQFDPLFPLQFLALRLGKKQNKFVSWLHKRRRRVVGARRIAQTTR